MITIIVDDRPIDIAAQFSGLGTAEIGGIATFTGLVRGDDGVRVLELEHYPGVTETTLRRLAEQAAERWALDAVRITHRVGRMVPGDVIVFLGAAAPHRAAALEACAYLIDRLKTDAPFWKKETRESDQRWVEQRDSDDAAAARWDESHRGA
jgi:molybdopterin synthase catalytic subunit